MCEKNNFLNKMVIITITLIFIGSAIATCIRVVSKEIELQETIGNQDEKVVTCYVFNKMYNSKQKVVLSSEDFISFYSIFKNLNYMINNQPFSSKTEVLKSEFAVMLDGLGMIPKGLSKEDVILLMNPSIDKYRPLFSLLPNPISNGRGSAFFCNFATWGEGSQFPVIILPRLIPILLVPIPRVIMRWNAVDGVTSCGGLLSGKGFIAEGAQKGTALGFWGIGFSVFLPPVMEFGFIGYALFATASADVIHPWPPNQAPVIIGENPSGGTWDVPLGLSELSFRIEDADDDRMSYWVTTDPDIGSSEGHNKKNGIFTIPVSGLECDKLYNWKVKVSDGTETIEKTFRFITVAGSPFNPFDDEWEYRKKITIDHSMVAGDLSNFPVLINVADSDLGSKTQPDGDDILFMDNSGIAKKIYHEIESFDDSSGELTSWVNIPSLSSTNDTILYMYYGNPGCSSQQFPEHVWDPNFIHVWHFSEILSDSAGLNDGVNHGSEIIPGIVGLARDFKRNECDYIDLDDMTQPGDGSLTTMTFEAWIKPESLTDGCGCVITSKYNTQGSVYTSYFISFTPSGNFRNTAYQAHGVNTNSVTSNNYADIGHWTYLTSTFNLGGTNDIVPYIDGNEVSDSQTTRNANLMRDTYISDEIGRYRPKAGTYFFDFKLDEMRWSKIVRSDDWIKTSFNTMNDPLSFLNVGPEESKP